MIFRTCIAICCFWLAWLVEAQSGDEEGAALYKRIDGADFVSLERDARALLQREPQNAAALFILGKIALEQARFPEALRWLRLAHEAASRGGTDASVSDQPHWPSLSWYVMTDALGAMDRRQEQLEGINHYMAQGWFRYEAQNKLERPLITQKTLALLKLGKTAEARALVDEGLSDGAAAPQVRRDWLWDKLKVLSATKADFSEALEVMGEIAAATKPPYTEAFHQWRAVCRFRCGDLEGMRSDLELAANADSNVRLSENRTNPWRELSALDFAGGNWNTGIDSTGRAWQVLAGKRARVRQDLHKDLKVSSAHAFTLMGCPDLALSMMPDVKEDPPRFGGAMFLQSSWQCWEEMSRWLAEKSSRQLRLRDPLEDSLKGRLSAGWNSYVTQPAREGFAVERILSSVTAQLSSPMKPVDSLSLVRNDPFLLLSLAEVLGGTAFEQLLKEYPLGAPFSRRYGAALDAEASWRKGAMSAAAGSAAQALEQLPAREILLRARMMVILAGADQGQSADWSSKAWRLHPAAFLLAGESLPVQLECDPGLLDAIKGLDSIVAVGGKGLTLRLVREGDGVQVSLLDGQSLLREGLLDGGGHVLDKKLKRFLLTPFPKGVSPESMALMQGQGKTKRANPAK